MLFITLLLSVAVAATPNAVPPSSNHIQQLLQETDGASKERAFKVDSVAEEYQIVRALGLTPGEQSLISDHGRMYDLLTVTDPKTHKTRDLWFDINSFFGKEF